MVLNRVIVHKKGQATLLVVLGILVLVMVILFFMFSSDNFSLTTIGSSEQQNEELENLKVCLASYGQEGLRLLEAQSGHIDEGSFYLVTKESMELELAGYVKERMERNCLNPNKYSIEKGELEIEAEINDGEISMVAEWPLQFTSIEDTELKFNLKNFGVDINTDLYDLFETASLISEGVSYNTFYANENEVNITYIQKEDYYVAILEKNGEYFIADFSSNQKMNGPEKEDFFEEMKEFVLGVR